jgi:hypothetical protein
MKKPLIKSLQSTRPFCYTILAGGYYPVIARYVFDSDASTLTLKKKFPTGENPTWIALHPTTKSVL